MKKTIAFLALGLFLVFLTLKLAETGAVVSWHWIWVFSPLWAPIAIITAIGIVVWVCLVLNRLYIKVCKPETYRKMLEYEAKVKRDIEHRANSKSGFQMKMDELRAKQTPTH